MTNNVRDLLGVQTTPINALQYNKKEFVLLLEI
jgi:hypothetical protein